MKKLVLLFFALIINHVFLHAQFSETIELAEPILGACNDQTCTNHKDGNNSLGQIYSNSACGLNFVQASRKVTTRYASPVGSGLPVALNISGIPACFEIEQAYLWWVFSGTTNTATATVTNPVGAQQTFNATLSGSGPHKCWSEGGTRHFRADVTSLITGNGNYNVNLSSTVWGTDGVTLIIVYRDLSATYTGNIYLNDGIIVRQGGASNQTLNFPAACETVNNAQAFSIVADMQDNVGATHTATHNGVNNTFPSVFYNFDQSTVTINNGQTTSNFGYNKNGDCYAWSVMGLYFQTDCVTCTPVNGTPSTATISETDICSGEDVTVSLNPIPTDVQWQSAPSSTGPWTNIAGAITPSYNSGALTNDICYRAIYPSTCGIDTSNIVCVTVNGLSTAPTGATASPSSICSAQPVTLSVQGGSLADGATWEWYSGSCGGTPIGSGETITVTPGTTTTYYVRAEGLCNTTTCASVTVSVVSSPDAQFTNSATCFPDGMNFTDNSLSNSAGNITSWDWDFGDNNSSNLQNPSHTYANAGSYNVTLIVENSVGCTDTLTQSVTVGPQPIASFDFTNVCDGLESSFTSTSTVDAPSSITNYSWDVDGDGVEDYNTQNVTHSYNGLGTHEVTLTVTSESGCEASITQTVEVFPAPVLDYAVTPLCLGNPTDFTNQTTVPTGGTVDSWEWNFGDGNTSALENPSHTYNAPGVYTVTLSAVSDNGCFASISNELEIFGIPTASFNFQNECVYDAIQFTNTSSPTATIFAWNFDDGSPVSTQANPTHNYAQPGTYDVTFMVYTSNGCGDTITQSVTVYPEPSAQLNVDPVCLQGVSTFTDQSTVVSVDGDAITQWSWNFGDGNSSNAQNPTNSYAGDGVYNVSLTVTTNNGCVHTANGTATVWPLPQVNFSSTNVCLNTATQFTDLSTISNQNPPNNNAEWNWNFGDGNTSTVQNPTHTYSNPGVFNITLVVTSNNGCSSQTTLPVTVLPSPTADFTGANLSGCSPVCFDLTSLSTVSNPSSIVNYTWSFTNGATYSSPNPNFSECFENNSGNSVYLGVTLTVTTEQGCTDSHFEPNYIGLFHNPIADFNWTPATPDILNPTVNLLNSSIYGSNYSWTIGDFGSSNEHSPILNLPEIPADYPVELIVTTDEGCADTAFAIITVVDQIIFYIPNTFTPDGDQFNEVFKPIFTSGFDPYDYHLTIFNRWGEIVFESYDADYGWDGTYGSISNGIVKEGTYIWKIEFKETMSDKRHLHTGHVNLLK